MRVLQTATLIEAHPNNYNSKAKRSLSSIKYICVHYTGNKNDTAKANCVYYRDTVVGASAHYYCRDDTIYQSVRDEYTAYAVGLGSRKEPYFRWPSMWKKVTNSNSISVEICGAPGSYEGSQQTKRTAAMLVADLMEKYHIGIEHVVRHYDVTGKSCPAWAVNTPDKWYEFLAMVNNYFLGKEDTDVMIDTPANYEVFKIFMDRYLAELAAKPADWETKYTSWARNEGLITDGRPKSNITRGEVATVLYRLHEQGRLETHE